MFKNKIYDEVTIVTVTHNSGEILETFLSSLDFNFNLIVVDNDSTDNTKTILKNLNHSKINLIFNKIGLGFGSAANIGISKSKTKYILLTNPDTKMDRLSIFKLYEAYKRYPNAAIISPLHKNSQGEVHLPTKPFFFNGTRDSLNLENIQGDCSVEHLSGAIMLVDKEKILKLGSFDENFFLYYEDDDLCIKSRKHGFENILVPDVTIEHIVGGSIGPPTLQNQWEKFVNMSYSRCYIEKKYFGNLSSRKLSLSIIVKSISKSLGHLITLQFKKILKDISHFYGAFIYLIGKKTK